MNDHDELENGGSHDLEENGGSHDLEENRGSHDRDQHSPTLSSEVDVEPVDQSPLTVR